MISQLDQNALLIKELEILYSGDFDLKDKNSTFLELIDKSYQNLKKIRSTLL